MNPGLNQHRQKGQMVVEAVLIMTVLFGITVAVSNFLHSSQTAKKLTSEPWERLAGMIECGSWQVCQGTPGMHPSSRDRNLSLNTGE